MPTALVVRCPKCDNRFTVFRSGDKCDECGKEVPPGVLDFSQGYEKQKASIINRDKFAGDTRIK